MTSAADKFQFSARHSIPQSPEELNASYESQGRCSHMNVSTCTEGKALVFLSQIWEFCSHSCRTHTVLQIKQLTLQPLSQQRLLSLKSRYTPLSVPHRNTVNRHLGMNGSTMTTKSHGKHLLFLWGTGPHQPAHLPGADLTMTVGHCSPTSGIFNPIL